MANSEVRDSFNAKGLQEANQVLDIMRLSKEDQYGYNRYMDSLSLKASEMYTLETEVQFKVEDIAKNAIRKNFDNQTISELTGLSIDKIEALRKEI